MAFSNVRIIDDAYISFRYSHNLAEGKGLVFNAGEYVEGYTNLLWTLLMAVPEALGIPVHLFAAYAGLTLGLLALFETWQICCLMRLSAWATAAAVLTLGAYPAFWLTATMGLEGGLFAFLLALAVRLLFSGRSLWAGFVGGLMFATRPESALLLGVFTLYVLIDSEERKQGLLSLVAPWLALVTTVTAWRLYYYGAWVPNTIAAKAPPERTLGAIQVNVLTGLDYIGGFLWSASPLVLGGALGFLARVRSPAVWLCAGCVLAEVPAVLINGGDWMPNFRLLSVYTPLLAVLLGVAVDRAVRASTQSSQPALLIALAFLVVLSAFLPQEHQWDPTPDANVTASEPCWQTLSEELKPVLLPSDVVAAEAIGILSYENPRVYVHDIFGLTDRHIALNGDFAVRQYGTLAPEYTYHEIQPDLILLHSGLHWATRLVHASAGTYEEEYRTYELAGLQGCPPKTFVISIREEHIPRILPALAELTPQSLKVHGTTSQ